MNTATLSINVYRGATLVASHTDLNQEVVKIGRIKSCHLCLEDEALARMHAIIERTEDELRAIDLGSPAGISVNGARVDRSAALCDGDSIELGPYRLEVQIKTAAPVLTPPARPQTPRRAARRPSAITVDPREVEIHDGTRVAEVIAVYGDTVLDVQHVGQREERRASAPTWMALGGLLALGGVAMFGYEASRDWDGYREAAQAAVVDGAPTPVKPGTGLGGLGLGLALLGLVPFSVGAIRLSDASQRDYSIGEGHEASFPMDGGKLPSRERFPLVEDEDGELTLSFTADMDGEVHYDGEQLSLDSLVKSGRARARGDRFSFALPAGANCRLAHDGVNFFVNSVAPGARLARKGETDKPFWLYNGGSLAVLGGLILFGQMIPEDVGAMSLDEDEGVQRFVGYMSQPNESEPEPEPEPEEAEEVETSEEAGGQGQRARGPEGKMGNPKTPASNNHYAIKGTSAVPRLGRSSSALADASNAGILGLMQDEPSSMFAALDGSYAEGDADANFWGNITGAQPGEAYGVGGLGLVGTGRQGGGTGEGTIGLGNVPTIGHGSGGGPGTRVGRGAGFGDRTPRRARKPRIGKVKLNGSLDKDTIRRIVRAHINEVRHCYQQGLARDPNLKGRVSIQFQIGGTGKVILAVPQSSNLKDGRVGQCVAKAVRRWKFPRPRGGGSTLVTYPFVFNAQ